MKMENSVEKDKEIKKLKQDLAAVDSELALTKQRMNEITIKTKENHEKQTEEMKRNYEAMITRYQQQMQESNKQ